MDETLDERYDTDFEIKKLDMSRKRREKTADEVVEERW